MIAESFITEAQGWVLIAELAALLLLLVVARLR
jgi:hypothetical protein